MTGAVSNLNGANVRNMSTLNLVIFPPRSHERTIFFITSYVKTMSRNRDMIEERILKPFITQILLT